MQFIIKSLIATSLLTASSLSLAETNQSKASSNEESLVSRVLSKSPNTFNSNFNQLNQLSIQRNPNHKIHKDILSAKIDIPTSKNVIDKLNSVASSAVKKFSQTGLASWYGRQFHGRPTANGETHNMNALTAAHPTLPMNCYVRVTNEQNGKSVIVKINDRSPFQSNRVLDLSYAAAQKLGMVEQSNTAKVRIERVDGPNS